VHQLKLLCLLLLAGCVQTASTKVDAFRPAKAPIYSAAAFDATRLEGRWQQVAAFTSGAAGDCKAGAVEFARGPVGLNLQARLCLNGQDVLAAGPVLLTGPGRLAVPGMSDWWVIWVDSGYRTLAIGTPDGRFGFVLDRGQIGPDRLAAAAEIFDFNGYNKARLQPF
jgi:apolipoprotein D and lipocalin family protein